MSNPMETRGGKRPGAGRPPGMPNKISRPLKELAALEGEACIETLKHLRDYGISEQVRIAAAGMLLDRGYGKPHQEHKLSQDNIVKVIVARGGYKEPIPITETTPDTDLSAGTALLTHGEESSG